VIRGDPARWQALVEAAQPVVDYYFELVRQEEDLATAQGKSAAVDRLAPLIREVADEVQRAHYVQQLARLVQTDERTVERLVLRQPTGRPVLQREPAWEDADEDDYLEEAWEDAAASTPQRSQVTTRPSPTSARPLQLGPGIHCLALLVLHPQILPQLQAELAELGTGPLDEDDFDQVEERTVCAALLAGNVPEAEQGSRADQAMAAVLGQLRAYGQGLPVLSGTQLLKDAVDSVLRLRIANLQARSRQLPSLVREAEEAGEEDEAIAYRQLLRDLGQHRLLLEQTLNARTHSGRRQAIPSL
jgi:DNA primase